MTMLIVIGIFLLCLAILLDESDDKMPVLFLIGIGSFLTLLGIFDLGVKVLL